jgi:signal transduction histidine kinase
MIRHLLRSSPFRITLLFLLAFTISSVTMLSFIYFSASSEFEKTLQNQIMAETVVLQRIFDTKGFPELIQTIQARANAPGTGAFLYALLDRHGTQLIGNLPSNVLHEGWRRVKIKGNIVDPEDEGTSVLAMYGTRLSNGSLMIVGAGLDQSDDLWQIIVKSLISSLALILPLALVGGIFLSRATLARVSTIHRASKKIMAGHLSQRLPIRGSRDEFDQLSESMNAMLDRIEELMGTMKQVTTDIAHDLRTPLGRLRQRLEGARSGNPTVEDCLDALDNAKSETDQILQTFDALLQIGQINTLDMRKRFKAVDLSELTSQLVESYQPVATEKTQQFTAQIAPDLKVQGHRELLAQMLVNLIENAINHCPEGANINLRAFSHEGTVTLIFSDTGPGIPPAHRKNIFQPFYRLERSRKTPGSGLGLALVRSIATIHGVSISLDDNDPGLTIRLIFLNRKGVLIRT